MAFLLFQGISAVAALAFLLSSGVTFADMVAGMATTFSDNPTSLILGNTVGQFLGLLLPAYLFTRLHTKDWRGFLRINPVSGKVLVLSIIALLALIPVVQWFGGVSDSLPWPQFIRDIEQAQMDLIEQILTHDFSLWFTISMLALTPAICEEILFRGYVQRQAERSMGVVWGILFSGIVFGLYHFRLTQAIPLSMLGVFMAYLTWRTNSIWPAILVHLANNSFAAVIGKIASTGEAGFDLESFEIPLSIVLPSAILLGLVMTALHKYSVMESTEGAYSDGGDSEWPEK